MTVRGNHLMCDSRNFCLSCSNSAWSSNIPKPRKYYRCEYCNLDILCDLGLIFNFEYTETSVNKIPKCNRCGEVVSELLWPKPTEKSD